MTGLELFFYFALPAVVLAVGGVATYTAPSKRQPQDDKSKAADSGLDAHLETPWGVVVDTFPQAAVATSVAGATINKLVAEQLGQLKESVVVLGKEHRIIGLTDSRIMTRDSLSGQLTAGHKEFHDYSWLLSKKANIRFKAGRHGKGRGVIILDPEDSIAGENLKEEYFKE